MNATETKPDQRLGVDDRVVVQYTAALHHAGPPRSFSGVADLGGPFDKYTPTAESVAWRIIRGHCDRPGVWTCSAIINGGAEQSRLIEVYEFEGSTFRRDIVQSETGVEIMDGGRPRVLFSSLFVDGKGNWRCNGCNRWAVLSGNIPHRPDCSSLIWNQTAEANP